MKRIVLFSLCCVLMIGALPLFGAAEKEDLDALWEAREITDAVEFSSPESDSAECIFKPVFRYQSDAIALLLYTRVAKNLTVKMVCMDEEYEYPDEYMFEEHVPTAPREGGDPVSIYIPELLPMLQKCYASYEGKDGCYGFKILPCLRAAIKEFGLTKKELAEACKLSRKNPDAVKKYFSEFTDEDFEKMKNDGELTFYLDQSRLLDALFVEKDEDCALLCITPIATVVDGVLVRQSDFFYGRFTPEMLFTSSLSPLEIKSFKALLRHARAYFQVGGYELSKAELPYAQAALVPFEEMLGVNEEKAPTVDEQTMKQLTDAAKGAIYFADTLYMPRAAAYRSDDEWHAYLDAVPTGNKESYIPARDAYRQWLKEEGFFSGEAAEIVGIKDKNGSEIAALDLGTAGVTDARMKEVFHKYYTDGMYGAFFPDLSIPSTVRPGCCPTGEKDGGYNVYYGLFFPEDYEYCRDIVDEVVPAFENARVEYAKGEKVVLSFPSNGSYQQMWYVQSWYACRDDDGTAYRMTLSLEKEDGRWLVSGGSWYDRVYWPFFCVRGGTPVYYAGTLAVGKPPKAGEDTVLYFVAAGAALVMLGGTWLCSRKIGDRN